MIKIKIFQWKRDNKQKQIDNCKHLINQLGSGKCRWSRARAKRIVDRKSTIFLTANSRGERLEPVIRNL